MAFLAGVRQGLHSAGKFVRQHGATIGKGLLTAAAVGAAIHKGLSGEQPRRSRVEHHGFPAKYDANMNLISPARPPPANWQY
jgi:hypothetical protein